MIRVLQFLLFFFLAITSVSIAYIQPIGTLTFTGAVITATCGAVAMILVIAHKS